MEFKKGDHVRTTSDYARLAPLRAFRGVVSSINNDLAVVLIADTTRHIHPSCLEIDPDYQEAHEGKTDYTGCHPVIAASLKRGEHILCRHPGNHEKEFTVCAYVRRHACPYRCTVGGGRTPAEPIPISKKETRVIGRKALTQALLNHGYLPTKDAFEKKHGSNIVERWTYNIF